MYGLKAVSPSVPSLTPTREMNLEGAWAFRPMKKGGVKKRAFRPGLFSAQSRFFRPGVA